MRRGVVRRRTGETEIEVEVGLEGEGKLEGSTGIHFLDHILSLLAHHSLMNISLKARWDLVHHGVEDVAITLGSAIGKALGERAGIRRFGFAVVPMDEALAEVAVDLVTRSHSTVQLQVSGKEIEDMKTEDIIHFFESLALSIPGVIHMLVRYGFNEHHKVEAAVKALAVALRSAWSPDPDRTGAPSSKGVM